MLNTLTQAPLFWGIALAMLLMALAFVLPPFLRRPVAMAESGRRGINVAVYRDQLREMEADRDNGLLSAEQFEAAKIELEARMAEDVIEAGADAPLVGRQGRGIGFSLAALVPVVALGAYVWLGNPGAIVAQATAAQNVADVGASAHNIEAMLKKVEEKIKANPKDVEAWMTLGKTYGAMDRWPEAIKAFKSAFDAAPQGQPSKAAALAYQGEALAMQNGRNLDGEPIAMIRQAMEMDPNQDKALELMGIHAIQSGSHAQAAYYWKRLLKALPAEMQGTPYAQDIEAAMKEAKRMAEEAAFGKPVEKLAKEHGKTGGSLGGMIEIAPALKAKINPTDTIFLFARQVDGTGAPVAALRAPVGDKWPIPFSLDDKMAMMPDNTLSNYETVQLTARITKSGSAEPKPGDLEGRIAAVKVGSQGIKLVIDRVR